MTSPQIGPLPQDPQSPVAPPAAAPQAPVKRDPTAIFDDPDDDKLFKDALRIKGYYQSQEAKGFLENASVQSQAVAKAVGDGMLNSAFFAWKSAAGLGAGLAAKFQGDTFGHGWDYAVNDVRAQLQQAYGSEDPGILDVMSSLWNGGTPASAAVFNPETGLVDRMSVGEAGDVYVQERLGKMAAVGQTIGSLIAFATGPNAAIGRASAGVAGVVTRRIDSAIAGALARRVGAAESVVVGSEQAMAGWGRAAAAAARGGEETAKTVLGQSMGTGDALRTLGSLPQWKAMAGNYERMLRLGGRTLTDTLDVTAANIAQSYAIEKDADRQHGLVSALAVSWAAAPLAKLGQSLGERVMASGLLRSKEATTKIADIYGRMANGKISLAEADRLIGQVSPQFGRTLLANSLTAAFEGTAFMSLPMPQHEGQPSMMDLWRQWQAGDDDAGAALFASWLGTVGGVVATKYAVPQALAPQFRSLRPDLNTLSTRMEAEAFRRLTASEQSALEQAKKAPAEPSEASVLSEGQAGSLEALGGKSATEQDSMRQRRAKLIADKIIAGKEDLTPDEVSFFNDNAEMVSSSVEWQQANPASGSVIGPQPDPLQVATNAVEQMYGWASPWTSAPLRAGWEPEFLPGPERAVRLVLDRDFHAELTPVDEHGAKASMVLNGRTLDELRKWGRAPETVAEGHPDRNRVLGDPTGTIDALSMLSMSRRMQGDIAFERLGMHEVAPGLWSLPEDGRLYHMQLDGRVVSKLPQDESWSKPTELTLAGGIGTPDFKTDGVAVLQKALALKFAMAPEPLVDTILTTALTMAQHSDSAGARELRHFLDRIDPVELRSMLEKGSDEWLAHILGSLSTGHNNAENALREVMTDKEIAVRDNIVQARVAERAKQERLAGDQQRREEFATRVAEADVPGDSVGKARIGSGIAEVWRRMVPAVDDPVQERTQQSVLGRISRREGPSGAGELGHTRITADELRSMTETWARRMELHRQERFPDTPESRLLEAQIARVDRWLSDTAESMGIAGIGETGHGVAMDVPREPRATVGGQPDAPPPDSGSQPSAPPPSSTPAPSRDLAPPQGDAPAPATRAALETAPSAPQEPASRQASQGGQQQQESSSGGYARAPRQSQNEREARQERLRINHGNLQALRAEIAAAQRRSAKAAKSGAAPAAIEKMGRDTVRLERRARGLEREIELSQKWLSRSDEENAAISKRMQTVRRKPETVLEWIAKTGGIKVDIVDGKKRMQATWPHEGRAEDLGAMAAGKPLFSGGGRNWDQVVQSAISEGFFPGRSVSGGDSSDSPAEIMQEILDSGSSIVRPNDPLIAVQQQREEASIARDRQRQVREHQRQAKASESAVADASAQRGIGRRLSDIKRLSEAMQSGSMSDEGLPAVTDGQVALASDLLSGERMRIEEGGSSPWTAEDIAAISRTATRKQIVAIANELRLETEIARLRDSGDEAAAASIDNLLKTGTAEQIAKKVAELDEDSAAFSGIRIVSPKTQRAIREAARKYGKNAFDWFVTDRLELLQRASNKPWISEMRRAISMQRSTIGEAQILFSGAEATLRKMKQRAMTMVTVDETPMPRWQAIVEERVAPVGRLEEQLLKSARETGLFLWNKARDAGVRRGEWDEAAQDWRFKLLPERDRFIMPRQHGVDWDSFMGQAANRRRLWSWLIDHNDMQIADRNPDTGRVLMNGGEPVLRQMTPDDLEARWVKQPSKNVESAEEQAAFEFVRRIRNFPAMFEGHALLQTNPFEAFRRLIHEQSGRVATVSTWGQDFSKAARFAIETTEGVKLPPGAEESLRRYQETLNNGPSIHENESHKAMAEAILVQLQGTNPQRMHSALRALQPIESFARAAMTYKAWIHDIPGAFVQGAAYAGTRRMLRAVAEVARSPREAVIATERIGSIFRATGMRDPLEADAVHTKIADAMGWLGMRSEELKTAAFDRMAVEMLSDWSRGRRTENDRDVLGEMLRFSEPEIASLLSGDAPKELQTRFRQEFNKLTTGRRTKVEGSQFLADTNLQQVLRFGNWISGRMVEMARLVKSVGPGHSWQQRARAMRRLSILAGGYAVLGTLVTTPIAYLLADAFKGENGLARWIREMSFSPASVVAGAIGNQVVGGPTAQALQAIRSPGDAKQWTALVAPLSMAHAVAAKVAEAVSQSSVTSPGDLAEAVWRVGWAASGKAAAEAGIIPADVRNLVSLVQGWAVGADPQQRSDEALVRSFKRASGVQDPQFARTKAPAFYDALGGIRRAIGRHPDNVKAAMAEAADDIAKALQLAPEESLAASIRTMQHLDGLTLEQRQKLADYADSPEWTTWIGGPGSSDDRMARIFAHDLAVRELASAVGKMHGEPTTPFADTLEAARSQARLGAPDVWNKLLDQVTDDAEIAVRNGGPLPDDVRLLAEAMANHPETLTWLQPRQRNSLSRQMNRALRARILQTIVMRRARERVVSERRDELKSRQR